MLQIKVLRNKRIKLLKTVMLTMSALIVLTVALIIVFNAIGTTIKVEAGEKLDLSEIFNRNDVDFDVDFNKDNLNHPGTYESVVLVGNKPKKVKIVVTDTKAPEIKVHDHVFVHSTKLPSPEELVSKGYDPDGYTGKYLTNTDFEFKIGKSYSLSVVYSDPSGNKTQTYEVKVSFIEDTVAPNIDAPTDLTFATDEAISYKSIIAVTDNCIGDVTLEVDDTAVDYKTPGVYSAVITATDVAGNTSTLTVNIHITAGKDFNPSLEKLNKKLATIVPTFISSDMTTEEKCRQIYTYVQKSITYAPQSISHDYVEVAYDALFVSGEGDCFAYFSAAKAILDYLGIENMDIERSEDNVEGTHFWNYVNIGTKNEPAWYHFDCTELTHDYNETGCLLTNVQVKAYDTWRYDSLGTNFRQYDKTKYPKAATKIITETPNLKDYMD